MSQSETVALAEVVDTTADIDLALLLADAITFRRLATAPDPFRALVLGPYVATFAVESLHLLQRRRIATGTFGAHADAIAQCRHALKFLDDEKRGASGVLATFERMGSASYDMFVASHKGLLGPLKRMIQTDLSLFIDEGRMIGTSHSVMVQQLSHREQIPTTLEEFRFFGPELRERSFAIGRYIAAVLTAFNINLDTEVSPTLAPSKGVDVKSHAFYGSLIRTRDAGGLGLAMLITSLLSSTNFVLHALPATTGRGGAVDSWFAFKWRLVTLFHVYSSLHQIAGAAAKDGLRLDVLNEIVALRRASKHVEKLKPVRDALVHYGLAKPSKRDRATAEERLARCLREHASTVEDDLVRVSTVLTRFFPRTR